MKHKKKKMIACCVAIISAVAITAVGCTKATPKPSETPKATAQATPKVTAKPTAKPTATTQPTAEATATPEAVKYTKDEIANAKKVVEAHCKKEKITAEKIDVNETQTVQNEMTFTVTVKDSKNKMEVIVNRTDAKADWKIKPAAKK